MVIKINNLKEGTHLYNLDEEIENVGLEEPFFDKVHIGLNLQKLHNQIVLKTELGLKAHFECDRCTAEFVSSLKTEYQMVYLFDNTPVEDDESINVIHLPLDASEISLDGEIRDYALLAIPMKKLCREDCKGLCPECGKNLNEGNCKCADKVVDPRWLPLQDLKSKIENN